MAVSNEQIAKDVLAAVGGRDNITSVTHCMTRLRFNLKDMGILKEEEIKNIKGVLGAVNSGGQLQVIIGQNVPKIYVCICELADFKAEETINENLDGAKEKLTPKKIGSNIMNFLSGSMTPLIPVMVAAGMFKTLMVLLGPDTLGLFTAESDAYIVFDFLYDAFFYFLPVFIGATAAKRLGIDIYLGIFVGAILVVPDFVALNEVQESVKVYGFFPASVGSYGQTIIPIFLTMPVMALIYKFFRKIIPDILSTIFVPFLTALIIVPIELCVLAPIGGTLGGWLGSGLLAFGGFGGFMAVAALAGVWEFLIMTGALWPVYMFALTTLMSVGSDNFIFVAGCCATWATFGLAFGAALRMKNKEDKALAFSYFVAGILGGVTEPTMYGIGFKYKRPLIWLVIGGALGGLYAGITHVAIYFPTSSNFLALLGLTGGGTANIVNGVIACLISMVSAAVLTFYFGFKKEDLMEA